MVPFPSDNMALTTILVVRDMVASKRFYLDVLGAELYGEYGGTSTVLRFLGNWLLLVTGGPPTPDKPTVTFTPPTVPDSVSHAFTIRVSDCEGCYATLSSRGAKFLTPPRQSEGGSEIRAFFRDPDGHLFEISQLK
jgi:catechol 2,3-dioxygenase-like lactoylglutathione lyase family enzyme